MKQYIKKALWIIPFVFSLNLSAQNDYFFVGTVPTGGYGDASDLNNWNTDPNGTSGSVPPDFESGDVFYTRGKNIEFKSNVTLGDATFANDLALSTSKMRASSGVIIEVPDIPPTFISSTSYTLLLEFDLAGKWIYNSTSSSGQNIAEVAYFDLTLEGSDKTTLGSISVSGELKETSGKNITITGQFNLKANMTFNVHTNTKFYMTGTGDPYYIDDLRNNKTFPVTFIFSGVGGISPALLPYGTYNNVILKTTHRLGGPLTTSITEITGNLDLSQTLTGGNHQLRINGKTLILSGTITNNSGSAGIIVRGSTTSTLKCSTNNFGTLYFDQSSVNNRTLNNLEMVNSTFQLGNNMIVKNSLILNGATLKIGSGNTLTVQASITSSNAGKFAGSSTSNLICSTANCTGTIYFDQTSGESGRTIQNLTITSGADVTLGNWLNIIGGSSYGLLTVNASSKCSTNNYLILKADANGYAQVANSAGSIVGELHVQTYFPATAGRGYRFISSQVKDGYFYTLRDSGSVASGGPKYGAGKNRTANVGIQITGTSGSSKGFDVSTTNNPSAFYFDETKAGNIGLGSGTDGGWYAISDVSATGDKLISGKGYRVLVRGDRSINLTGTAANQNATTTQVTGTYPNSAVQIPITNSANGKANDGINLVGNPYPANLSWSAIYSANSSIGLDAAYAVYDVQNGRYNVYNAPASAGTASDNIAAGQGFLVYTSSSSANLTISESCKNTSALGDRYFKKQRSNHLVINMSYDTLYSDKSIIYFLPGSTQVYDIYDAGHIQNPYVNLSSLDATNSQYALNCLDTLDTEKTVPLSVKGTAPGDFSMTFEDCGTFLHNDIYLLDKYLNKKIKIDDWTKYDFSITADPFTAEDGRLSLLFTPKEASKITSIDKTTSFSISPNPVTDNFIINYKENNNLNVEYSIVNAGGQEVKKGKIQTNDKVNTKDLARGIYFMTVKSQTESQTIKFIK